MKIDEWIWGKEKIIWGYDPSHQYTFKILEPKVGRLGCLSLQYHNAKSETWLQLRGVSWILVVVDGTVCTKLMRPGDVQPLPQGVIHRLMGVTSDVQVVEPSTPDKHAADKTVPKDVIRLHCVLGREVSEGRNDSEKKIILECIQKTEEAIAYLEAGKEPKEYNIELLKKLGADNVGV